MKKKLFTDGKMRGLVLEVRDTGGKTYYLRQPDERGNQKLHKIARAEDIAVADARKLAEGLRRMLIMGEDPKAQKEAKKNVPTFQAFTDEKYLPFIDTYKKSAKTDVSLLKNHLLPALGRKYLDEITTDDIEKLVKRRIDSGAAPASVNRLTILARYMFNLAKTKWKIQGITENPTSAVNLLPVDNKRERYLSDDETVRLCDAVNRNQNKELRHIVAALILTGARRSEVLDATWNEIDFERRSWRITRTKGGTGRHIPINDQLMTLLRHMQKRNTGKSRYIFGNPKSGKPYVSVFHSWNTARTRAGLPDVRMHDLRHNFASLLINSRRSIYEVKELLGHTQIKTTMRYAHLSNETLLDASNATARLDGILGLELAT
ncbi:site-specific integrase [Pseudosulfitobacter pseudonitzschiae]|nr:site-specific integrase [Pseudosulfitobacter pseudonitzschiae]MBM1817414.1 tyrosine-type recombinase/integrase [Pseudosulfitobacter pseudonitzschiae]MBM1834612.1 tyrosine-type recombinase/integrase [Pseudosulfitobacter pseudonitzschiae]MBM1844327.1 tyrosine-type recombinase/integrase [Pseudosulfitobacter pseudonitzschiae]MBM1849161.1 tyrosine-type recombinase/integrase [Pseudosulfitobacter pseudonitzschiae]MBM1854022.1 tyrosine-type recombinase/integrase [Pseudosulfitobacter pseudonitzschia